MKKTKHGRTKADEHIPDPEKIKDILVVVSDRVPELLRKLSDVLYGPDQAKKFGKAAAIFYEELKDTGMTEKEIFELTRDYMATLNLGNVFSGFAKDHERNEEYDDEFVDELDLDEELESHVRKRLKKRFEEK
jgi:hypothetical protein